MVVHHTKQCCRNNLLMFLIYFTISAAQNITLYSYNQSDSETSCKSGLRNVIDRFVFKSNVDLQNASSDWSRVIGYEYKSPTSNDYILFCFVDLRPACRGYDGTNCYCNHTDINGIHHIIINAVAQAAYNNSLLRGYLLFDANPKSFSTPQEIPTIYDTAVSSRRLTVNDIDLQSGLCLLKLQPLNKIITFCCTISPTPCVTRILSNGSLLTSGTGCVEYTTNDVTEYSNVTFTFAHAVCGVENPTEYQCIAILDKECTTECGWEGILVITIYIIFSTTSVIVGVVLLVSILNKWSNFTVLALTCTHVSMLMISIIIIIIQASVDPCTCDPDNVTITINIWAIFLINYFVIFFLFTITVVLVLLYMFYTRQDNYLKLHRRVIFFILNFTIVVPIFRTILFLYEKTKRSISLNEINPVKDKSGQTQELHKNVGLNRLHKSSDSVTFSNDKSSSKKTNSIEPTFIDNNKKSDKKTSGKMLHTPMAANGHDKADPNNQKKENTNKDKNTAIEDKQATHKSRNTKH